MRRSKLLIATALVALVSAAAIFYFAPVEAEARAADAQTVAPALFSYAVKFVCGFNPTQAEFGELGEATVKLGNYATDINIFNPALNFTQVANIRKKIAVLSIEGEPIGREPNFITAEPIDFISLPGCAATMDDCNRIYELFFGAIPPAPAPPLIGYFVLQSDREIDVTAVYTAEVCSDWVFGGVGGQFMCSSPDANFGAGISIDVERIEPKRVQ